MCWRLRNVRYLNEEIPLSKDELECMREAAYQSSAYSTPGPSNPPAQLDPGALYDWRRGGVSTSAPPTNGTMNGGGGVSNGGGAKRPSTTPISGNTLLKQAIANRMISLPKDAKEPKDPKDPKDPNNSKDAKSKDSEDAMSTSLVMNAAWYRDDDGRTGFKNREWEKANKIQKDVVKERPKKEDDDEGVDISTVEEIDEELIGEKKKKEKKMKKDQDGLSIKSDDSRKETKEEKKEREKIEKEKKKEEKKKEKERQKAEEKEKKEEAKKEKERRKRSESPKSSKIEKAEVEKEKRESKENDDTEDKSTNGKPPKDPAKLKKTRSEDSTTSRTGKSSDSPRNTTLGDRRDSTMSESSRLSTVSHKSVKFNDRVQVNEIERRDDTPMTSSDDDEYALMSEKEMRRLREAADARPPPQGYAHFDEDYGYEHWNDAGSGDYIDLDQLPVSVRRAIELEYSSRLAALRGASGRQEGDGTGSMTRLHEGAGSTPGSSLLGAYPVLPRSASGYFEDPLRDSYQNAIDHSAYESAMKRQEEVLANENRRKKEWESMQQAWNEQQEQQKQATAAVKTTQSPPMGLPVGDMTGSFYDNVQGKASSPTSTIVSTTVTTTNPNGVTSKPASPSNSEMFSYAPRRRQNSEVLQARAPGDTTPLAIGSPTPSVRSVTSADRDAFFAAMGGTKKDDRSSSSAERQAIFGMKTEEAVKIGIMEATPPPDGTWNEAEERMRKRFVERFGARKAPVAESEFMRRGSEDSVLSTDSRESVVSATSLRAEPAVRRHFNY